MRDYFRIEDEAGGRYRVFRRGGWIPLPAQDALDRLTHEAVDLMFDGAVPDAYAQNVPASTPCYGTRKG